MNAKATKYLQLVYQFYDAPQGPEKIKLCDRANKAFRSLTEKEKTELRTHVRKLQGK